MHDFFFFIDGLHRAIVYNILFSDKTRHINVQSAYLNIRCYEYSIAVFLCLRQKAFRRLNLDVLLME